MALNFNRNTRAAAPAPEFKPADKWINFSLPTAGGKTRQITGVPLSKDDPRQAKLIELIDQHGIEALGKALVIEYRDGAPSPDNDFVL